VWLKKRLLFLAMFCVQTEMYPGCRFEKLPIGYYVGKMKKMHLALIAFTFEGILMSNVNVID
jgi:hypothetical protein